MLPNIKFSQLSLDEVVNVLSWTIFSNSGPLPISKIVYQIYPELKDQVDDSMEPLNYSDICNLIKPIIANRYESHTSKKQKFANVIHKNME